MNDPQQRPLTSFRGKAANGYRLYEIDKVGPLFIKKASEILQERFGFAPLVKRAMGLDTVLAQCSKDESKVLLSWDNWCGLSIMAESPDGEFIVDQFGDYVDSILNDTMLAEYLSHESST